MSDKKNKLPKVYPFVQPDPPPHPRHPTTPQQPFKSNSKVSQRGLLSAMTLLLSLGSLTIALLGGAKLVLDIFSEGLFNKNFSSFVAEALVLGIAYFFGWLAAIVCVRVYNNLILPMIIQIYTWGCLIAVDYLYLKIIQKLYAQGYDIPHYLAYCLLIAAGLGALVGLHLILDGHDLRPYALPLFAMCLVELAFIVFRYIFTTDAKPVYLFGDLIFLGAMIVFSILMLAHLGLLAPLRRKLTSFFDRNSIVIRPEG
jgi:hypothetical protein